MTVNTSRHTSGPWTVGAEIDSDKKLVYIRIESLNGNVGTTGVYGHKRNGSTAGRKYFDRFGTERHEPVITADEARANAKLIAAAPELLHELEDLFREWL